MPGDAEPSAQGGLTSGIIFGSLASAAGYAYAVWFSFRIGNPVGLFPGHILGSLAGPFVACFLNRHHPLGNHVKVAFTPAVQVLGGTPAPRSRRPPRG